MGTRLPPAFCALSNRSPMTRGTEPCYVVGHGLPSGIGHRPGGRRAVGRTGARELVTHALDRIEALNPTVNAFVAVDDDRPRSRPPPQIDDMVAAGDDPGPLAGIPIGVKDLEDAAGFVTSHGSPVFAGGAAATADSPLVARLQGGRMRGDREDQHAGARMEGRHRQRGLRRHLQPVEPRSQPGRLVRWQRRRHRRRAWSRWPPGPTVAVRSASRRRAAA